jgi:hypothetical protein
MGSIESAIEVVGAIWQDIERGQGRHLRGYSVSADRLLQNVSNRVPGQGDC